MTLNPSRVSAFAAVLFLLAIPAFAHHSRAQYDMSKVITLKATVTKVDWTNPHTLIYFDVNGNGNVQNWNAITGGPGRLQRQGWTSETVKPGDPITISGWPMKSGAHEMWLTSIVLANGRQLGMHR
jgi:hypothetical protein